MKIKKQYLVFILVFLFLLIGTTVSFGAFSATNSTTESGGKITVKVTSSEALDAYNLDLESCDGLTFNSCSKVENGAIITINGSSIGYMNTSGKTTDLGTYNFTAPVVTEDKQYTVSFKVDRKTTVTSKITVKAPVVPPPSEPTTPTTPAEPTKSSEARLKNFGIKPNDFSGFKRDKTEYSTTVPNDVKEVEIYGEKLHDKATVEGLGKVQLKEGDNKFEVKVTAEDGKTTKTYTLIIKRKTAAEEVENGENRLKSLGIKPKEYDFSGFKSDKTEYEVEVPSEVEEIEVYATAMDSNAQVTGTGMITLEEGVNDLKIEVIAVNGEKKTYTIKVTRKATEKTDKTEKIESFGLSTLSIAGVNLKPSFKIDVYEYTAILEKNVSSLEIKAKANNEKAKIEIIGNENLKQGENVITILVTNEETEEVATYQIIVNKNVTEEVIQTSWLKPSTWGKEEKIKIAIIVVLILLIIWAIILKIKISKESSKKHKVDFPGAEELDKAIAEHQELAETPSYENDTVEEEKIETNNENDVMQQNYIEEIAKNKLGNIEEDNTVEKTKRRGRHF